MEKDIKLTIDELAIEELQYRYALAIDTKNQQMLRDVYADIIDYDFRGYALNPDMHAEDVPAESWVQGTFDIIKGLQHTEHQMTNFNVKVDGDTAEAIFYLKAQHFLPNRLGGSWCECGGYYKNKYVRTDKGWKIRKVNLNYFYWEGNQYVFVLSTQA